MEYNYCSENNYCRRQLLFGEQLLQAMESSLCERPLTSEVREGLGNFVMGTMLWELRCFSRAFYPPPSSGGRSDVALRASGTSLFLIVSSVF